MSSQSRPSAPPSSLSNSGMRGEIAAKWGKFSSQEIAALKDNDDLVAKVQTKYQMDKAQAQKDVDAFAKGRQL
jgi:hypothetical protein